MLQLILEDDAVDLDAVERQLLADRAADLGRAGRDEVHEDAPSLGARAGAERPHQRDHPGLVDLVLGALERHAHHLGEAFEVGFEIGLVEIPAVHDGGRRGRGTARAARPQHLDPAGAGGASGMSGGLRRAHRAAWMAAAISAVMPSRTVFAASFTALAIAWARERSCALTSSCSNPSSGAPPYCA